MTHTKEQRWQIEAAKSEIKKRIQQMVSSGMHDYPAIKEALEEIVGDWK